MDFKGYYAMLSVDRAASQTIQAGVPQAWGASTIRMSVDAETRFTALNAACAAPIQ